ncbi:MAG: polysaccharide deacetylase family protein [Alphaproteobacteria bacterium]
MKILYYHYVRPTPEGLPHFRYLHIEDFRAQLDHLGHAYGFVPRDAFLAAAAGGASAPEGVVLTFDDGFRDHHDHVLPELLRRGLWGLFYVPTGPYQNRAALSVHRVHYLLGRHGGARMLEAVRSHLSLAMLSREGTEAFRRISYAGQDNDSATTEFKRALNYHLAPAWRQAVLDRLAAEFGGDRDLVEELYMPPAHVRALQEAGMIVGSHSVTHPVLSTLESVEQRREIVESFDFLEAVTGGLTLRTFCYPYGHAGTYTAQTIELLAEADCRLAFTTGSSDVTAADLDTRPLALPRYDCNLFPHGRAAYGPSRPERA